MCRYSRVMTLVIAFLSCSANAALLPPTGGSGLSGEYAQASDSPFSTVGFLYFHLEDFEDLALNTPGLSSSSSSVINNTNSSAIDSVDSDDGVIDGSGSDGATIVSTGFISFTFDGSILGELPTHAGLVFTDGTPNNTYTFEAFDENGSSLGTLDAVLGDNSFFGTTAEDRFIGVTNASGVTRISLSDNGGVNNLEVDHVQYGRFGAAAVPAPGTLLLFGFGLIGIRSIRKLGRELH